jgi:hypothetical protein
VGICHALPNIFIGLAVATPKALLAKDHAGHTFPLHRFEGRRRCERIAQLRMVAIYMTDV